LFENKKNLSQFLSLAIFRADIHYN